MQCISNHLNPLALAVCAVMGLTASPSAFGGTGVISFEELGNGTNLGDNLGNTVTFSVDTGGTLSMTSWRANYYDNPTFRGFHRAHTGSRGLVSNQGWDPVLVFTTPTVVSGVWVFQEANPNQPAWYVTGSLWGVTKWTSESHAPGSTDGTWHQVLSGSAEPIDTIMFHGNNLFVDDLTVETAAGDTTPPEWASGWPKADTLTSTGFTARAKTNETGKAYYLVLAGGASAPSPATVKTSGVSIDLTDNTEATAAVTGLTPGTAYDVYFLAEDAVPNLQTADPPAMVSITTLTVFAQWAQDKGLSGVDALIGADPDKDGQNNLMEFALDGTPNNGALNGKVYSFTDNAPTDPLNLNMGKVLVLTIAVRDNMDAAFDGSPATAVNTADGIKYTIMGGTGLGPDDWGGSIIVYPKEILTTGMPAVPGTGYHWQSFILNSSDNLTNKGFMRVKVESYP